MASTSRPRRACQTAPVPVPLRSPWPPHGTVPFFAMQPRPPHVRVRQVTACNVCDEVAMIRSFLREYPFVAVDTEYPGTVHRPPRGTRLDQLTVEQRYALAKTNVDELHLLQLGITLCDARGRLPVGTDEKGIPVECAWQVSFADFDVGRDRHAPESVEFLRSQGFDFESARLHGVKAEAFAAELDRAGILTFSITWITYGGLYDTAYLLKLVTGGQPLPAVKVDFLVAIGTYLGAKLFDVKYVALQLNIRARLKATALTLGVPPLFPDVHLAGPNSVITCHAFMALRRWLFPRDGLKLALVIDGLR